MNSMDLVKSLSFLDDELISDAANDVPETGKAKAGGGGIKNPEPNKPHRGGVKVKALVISICAIVAAAAIVLVVLFATGVFSSKQVPVYLGMEISSAETSSQSSVSAGLASAQYRGDYYGKDDGIDKSDPFGNGGSAYKDAYESTLTVTGSGESIYYANEGESIYVTIYFDNPDYFDIESFVLSDGISEIHYSDYMFETGSNYEKIIVEIESEYVHVGITEYTISQIKYIDGEDIKDVQMNGDTVVICGVRSSSDMITATVASETVTLTSISFTANIVDTYGLIAYSGGYAQAILYDGENIVQTKDLTVGSNSVEFSGLTTDTIYQYAIVVYYDDLSGNGNVLSYLYSNTVCTATEVLFDKVVIVQEEISFAYSWYSGYANQTITKLTLICNGSTSELDASALSVSGLYSDTEYTLTAYYVDINGDRASITLTFTTLAKTVPTVNITANSTTSFNVSVNDTDEICTITSIGLYSGATLVTSYATTVTEITLSNLGSDTQYSLIVAYKYDLNDGNGEVEDKAVVYINSNFVLGVNDFVSLNSAAVSSGTNLMFEADIYNPSGVTVSKVVINGETYDVSSSSTTSTLYITITNDDQFDTGSTTFTLTQIICTYSGSTYTINVDSNNSVAVYILNDELGEIAVTGVSLAYYSHKQYVDVTEEYYYKLYSKAVYLKISIDNPFNNTISTVTYTTAWDYYGVTGGSSEATAYGVVVSDDYQTIYVPVTVSGFVASNVYGNGWVYATVKSINYTNGSKSASLDVNDYTVSWYDLGSSEEVEISTAEDFINMLICDTDGNYISKYYKLVNDIDLSGYNWATYNDYYINGLNGILDGNGYTISGFTYTATVDSDGDNIYGGLFGSASGLVINLNMTEVTFTVTNNTTQENVIGILASSASSYELRVCGCHFEYSARITNTKLGTVVTSLNIVGSGSVSVYGTTVINTASNVTTTYTEQNGYLIATTTDGEVYLTGYIGDETDLVVPDGVTAISDYAFAGSSITSITLSSSVKTIGNYAFSECSYLTSITLSDGLTSIGNNAFWYCWSLTGVTLPDSLTTIGDYAFSACSKITSISLPDNLTSIGEYAFSGTGISYVVIPDGITKISSYAFDNCNQLSSIVIPVSVTTIGEGAFNACSLSNVYYKGTATEWSSVSISSNYNDSLSSATVYYYSATQPEDGGNYWYYSEGGEITTW